MSMTVKPEVSNKNKYWISKHRFYELRHFCMQYPLWQKAYASIVALPERRTFDLVPPCETNKLSDPTSGCVEAKLYYRDRIMLLKNVAYTTDPVIGKHILKGVTEGLSYDRLNAIEEIPCSRDAYYELYRRFFWLLSRERG